MLIKQWGFYEKGHVYYHEGVFGKEVSAGYPGCPSWCAGVRCGWPSAEPATDCPNYEDSAETSANKQNDTV